MMKYFINLSVCLACLASCINLFAVDTKTNLDFSTGYRNDSLQRKNELMLNPPSVNQTDKIEINNISIWQVGLDACFLISPFSQNHFKEGSHFHNFFLSGFAYWGWNMWNPTLHETIQGCSQVQIGKAEVNDVHTSDYQIGAGYLIYWDHWNLAFSGGYAYDRQSIGTKRGEIAFCTNAPFQCAPLYGKGYTTSMTWKGPWIGINPAYVCDYFKAGAGYEYHFAHYTANHCIPVGAIAQLEGYKTDTKSSASGNVFFLDGAYLFCTRWEVGACFKYQHWKANHGHLTSPFFYANGFPCNTQVRASGKWISYGINLNIGCSF